MRRLTALGWLLAVLFVGGALNSIAGPGAAAEPKDAEPRTSKYDRPLTDITSELSAHQLADDFGVSLREARTRIDRQLDLDALSHRLELAAGRTWAWSFYDHANEGQLVVQGTDRNLLEAARRKENQDVARWAKVKEVPYSKADLLATQVTLESQLRKNGVDFIGVGPEYSLNRVAVEIPSENATRREGRTSAAYRNNRERATQSLETFGRKAALREVEGRPGTASCYTSRPYCDDSLRGGVAIHGGPGTCTLGFNARSRADGKPYVLTAGHCNEGYGRTHWYTYMPKDGVSHWIGYWHRGEANQDHDAGIITVDNPAGWQPAPIVLVRATVDDGRTTNYNEVYPIRFVRSSANLPADRYLCSTGASGARTTGTAISWTRCGQYHSGNHTGRLGTQNLARVDFDSCAGDSGGPVYAQNAAYGLVTDRSGENPYPRTVNYGFFSSNVMCGSGYSYYQGIIGAQDAMNVDILRAP